MDEWHFWHCHPSSHWSPLSPSKQLPAGHRVLGGREHTGRGSVRFEGSDATSGQPVRGASHQQVSPQVLRGSGVRGWAEIS